jgi:foldase protein PrsA
MPPPPPPPPPAPSGPPAWPFILGGVLLVALAVAAVFVFLDPLGGDDEEERSVPSGAVAVVGDEEISREEFDHWLQSAAKSQERPGGEVPVVLDPPEFDRCIAAKEDDPDIPSQSRESLEDQCQQEYDGLRDQVMQFLVSAEWIELEAEERDIAVSDREVRQAFDDQKAQSFPKERDYQEFLRTSGQTEEDLLYRVRVELLSQTIREEVTRESDKPDQEALDEFVSEFQERYRDITVCAEGYVTKECSNGPPLKNETGTTPTVPAPTTPDE